MYIERSSVGDAEFNIGFRFFGSVASEKRNTPGCVQAWRSPALPEVAVADVPVLVQPAARNASAAATAIVRFNHPLLPRPVRRASFRVRRRGCGRTPGKHRDRFRTA